jgi:hypothetical protein
MGEMRNVGCENVGQKDSGEKTTLNFGAEERIISIWIL